MSDLISRDETLRALSDPHALMMLDGRMSQETGEYGMMMRHRDVIQTIITAPAVDAVPVVRCKDCVNSYHNGREGTRTCRKFRRMVGVNSYCSCGIREDEIDETD